MKAIRSLLTDDRRGWSRDRLSLLALLAMPCLFALLLALPISEPPVPSSEPPGAEQQRALYEPREREPGALPLGVVWGICCASVFGIGLLAVPVRRLLGRPPPRVALKPRR